MKKTTITLITLLGFFILNAQNNCENAIVISEGIHNIGVIDGNQAPLDCTSDINGSNAEWFKYEAINNISITITSALAVNTGVDTRLNVYSGTCADLTCVGGDDDAGPGPNDDLGYTSIYTFNAIAGTDYYILFDNRWSNSVVSFELIEGEEYVIPPGGDVTFHLADVPNLGSPYVFVDMNNDDLDDLVTVDNNAVRINYQKEDGSFDQVDIATTNAVNNPSWSIAAGDLDGNGYMDLLYGGGQGATFMYGNKTETSNPANNYATEFTETSPDIYIFSQRTNFVDINNDGNLDAFVCHDVAPNVYFINDGNGGLETHQVGDGNSVDLGLPGSNYASIFFDYDNDHDIDMYISKCTSEPNQLIRNNGDGTYTNVSVGSGADSLLRTWASAVGDFNNDGYMDILIGASSGANGLMINNGDGTFTDITIGSGFDTFNNVSHEYIAEDFNNDGFIDVLSSGIIMINNGDMTFAPATSIVGEGAIGDGNNDGFLDVFAGGFLKVNNNTEGNWLKVNLTGNQSNLDGIGARIEIVTTLGTQIRDVKSGVGFKYMSSITAHFGLGEDTEIETLTIYWPSGAVDVISNPIINNSLNVVEGSSPLSIDENLLNNVNVYPNPVTNELTIKTTLDLENSVIAIFDVQGKKVFNSFFESNTLAVENLENGIYFLRIIQNEKQINLKFIKK